MRIVIHPPTTEADIAAKLAAIGRAYAATLNRDERTYRLLGALYLCWTTRPLPDWLFKALKAKLAAELPKQPGRHAVRWLMVLECKREREARGKKSTWEDAYDDASQRLESTLWKGSARTMRESCKIYLNKQRGKRPQPRPPRR
jgi:hypothetical protein